MVDLEDILSEKEVDRISRIFHGDVKLDFLAADQELLKILLKNNFNGYHVSQIVVGAGWKDKLDWIKENYQELLKPMGFTPKSTAKILYGKGWADKLRWIQEYYYPSSSSYSQEDVVRIMVKKDWRERLRYH